MAQNNTTAIAVTDEKITASVTRWAAEHFAPVFQGTAAEFTEWQRDLQLCIIENKDLREALATNTGAISLVRAAQISAASKLSLNPQKGESCIIPYKGKLSFVPMKNGYVELLLRTGKVKMVKVETVYANDEFSGVVSTNTGDEFRFGAARKDRGGIDGFLAAVYLKDGVCVAKYIDAAQAKAHKQKYSASSILGEKEYGEKTIVKMICRGTRLEGVSKQIDELLDQEDKQEAEELKPAEDQQTTLADEIKAAQLADEAAGDDEPEEFLPQDENLAGKPSDYQRDETGAVLRHKDGTPLRAGEELDIF